VAKKKRMSKEEWAEFDRRALANAQLLREYAGGKLDRERRAQREQSAQPG
jgi:hypothetical protein